MIKGWACKACQTPPKPTRASCASAAAGKRGMAALMTRPITSAPSTHHRFSGRSGPTQASKAGPITKVVPTMVSNRPTMRPRCSGGANSATTASAKTQRKPEAAPAMNSSANHSGSESVSKKPAAAMTGTNPESHSVGRRPKRCVMADTNGVTAKIPTQPLAANRPASVVDTPSPLSCRSK